MFVSLMHVTPLVLEVQHQGAFSAGTCPEAYIIPWFTKFSYPLPKLSNSRSAGLEALVLDTIFWFVHVQNTWTCIYIAQCSSLLFLVALLLQVDHKDLTVALHFGANFGVYQYFSFPIIISCFLTLLTSEQQKGGAHTCKQLCICKHVYNKKSMKQV